MNRQKKQRKQASIATAFVNLKGGVGKTSLAIAYARRVAASGRKVLLVDCDQDQANASWYLADNILEGDLPLQGEIYEVDKCLFVVWQPDPGCLADLSHRSGYDEVVFDGRPAGPMSVAPAMVSDRLVMPVDSLKEQSFAMKGASLLMEVLKENDIHRPTVIIRNNISRSEQEGWNVGYYEDGEIDPVVTDVILDLFAEGKK